MRRQVTLQELEETFYISSESPSGLKWNLDKWGGQHQSIHNVEKDSNCGTVSANGYWEVKHCNVTYKCHRIIYMLCHKIVLESNEQIDHIDGNGLNNSIDNLRVVTHQQNCQNRKIRSDSSTGVTGVNLTMNNGLPYARAHWVEAGKQRYKSFSVNTYGRDEAIRLATEYRAKQIEQLNAEGAGYTTRHGK